MSLQVVVTGPCNITADDKLHIEVIDPTFDALQQHMLQIQSADVVVLDDRDGILFDLPRNFNELPVFLGHIGCIPRAELYPMTMSPQVPPVKAKKAAIQWLQRKIRETGFPTDTSSIKAAVGMMQLLKRGPPSCGEASFKVDTDNDEYVRTKAAIASTMAEYVAKLFAGRHDEKEQEVILIANPTSEFAIDVLNALLERGPSQDVVANPVESETMHHPVFTSYGETIVAYPDFHLFHENLPSIDSMLRRVMGHDLKCRSIVNRDGLQVGFEARVNKLTMACFVDTFHRAYGENTANSLLQKLLANRSTIAPAIAPPRSMPTVTQPVEMHLANEQPKLVDLEACRLDKQRVEARLPRDTKNPIIGESDAILRIYPNILRAINKPDNNILIYGEVGTGKEVLLDLLKLTNSRPGGIKTVSLAGTTDDRIKSELFGHVKGAFTGAVEAREGQVLSAGLGTLVVDNAQSLSISLQDAMLRVLEGKKEFQAMGSDEIRNARCRFVVVFNVELEELLRTNRLLKDWPGRFDIMISIPKLDDRKDDIPLLAHAFEQDYIQSSTLKGAALMQLKLTDEFIDGLQQRTWAGATANVRGLKNAVVSELYRIEDQLANHAPQKTERLRVGRPQGRSIDDSAFVAILHKADSESWVIEKLKNEYSDAVTPEAFRKRIERIANDDLKRTAADSLRKLSLRYGWKSPPRTKSSKPS